MVVPLIGDEQEAELIIPNDFQKGFVKGVKKGRNDILEELEKFIKKNKEIE